MDYYNIFLQGFFFNELFFFFFKMVLSILFFSYWVSWEICFVVFFLKYCRLLQCFPTWFLYCYSVSPHICFFKIIFVEIFFNIKLAKNLALTFPTCFFFIFLLFFFQNWLFFFRIFFVDFIFLIESWLRI
jgi:hypothetical protein